MKLDWKHQPFKPREFASNTEPTCQMKKKVGIGFISSLVVWFLAQRKRLTKTFKNYNYDSKNIVNSKMMKSKNVALGQQITEMKKSLEGSGERANWWREVIVMEAQARLNL